MKIGSLVFLSEEEKSGEQLKSNTEPNNGEEEADDDDNDDGEDVSMILTNKVEDKILDLNV